MYNEAVVLSGAVCHHTATPPLFALTIQSRPLVIYEVEGGGGTGWDVLFIKLGESERKGKLDTGTSKFLSCLNVILLHNFINQHFISP